jgi:hypothetical protein
MAEQGYKPSERVPISGVYTVVHNGHRPEHEATLLKDEVFPCCGVCGEHVRFTLSHKGEGIRSDKDFNRR